MTSSRPVAPDQVLPGSADALVGVLQSFAGHPLLPEGESVSLSSLTLDGDTLLHLAASRGDAWEAEVLLAHGAAPNATGDMGNSALHYAAMNGHSALVVLLLRHGADTAVRNEFGLTPEEWAGQAGHVAAVAALRGEPLRR